MDSPASDLDDLAVRNSSADEYYINTAWSHDPEGESRVPTTSPCPLVPRDVLMNLSTATSHPGDGPRPLALGLLPQHAMHLDFDTLRSHMCRGCFPVSGMITKRALLTVLEAERSAGVLCEPPSWYRPSFREWGPRRIGLRPCASTVCFEVETEESGRFMLCSRCKTSSYCGPGCQKSDWVQRHKHACRIAAERRELEVNASKCLKAFVASREG